MDVPLKAETTKRKKPYLKVTSRDYLHSKDLQLKDKPASSARIGPARPQDRADNVRFSSNIVSENSEAQDVHNLA